jgi:uncharacterized RDD family membrane protein YckC
VASETWRYVLTVEGRETELSDGEVTLGRSRTATVRVDHESVSRSHALLTFDQGKATVKDLNSSNGTFVSGRRILNETHLVDGDRIQLGAAVLEFRLIPPPGLSAKTAMIAPALLSTVPPPAAAARPQADGVARPEPHWPTEPERPAFEHSPPAVPPPLPPGASPVIPMMELSASNLLRDADRDSPVKKFAAPLKATLSEVFEAETLQPENRPEMSGPPRAPAPAPPPAAVPISESSMPRVEALVRQPLARPDQKPTEPLARMHDTFPRGDAPQHDLADVSLQMSSIPTRPMVPPSSERAAAFIERRMPSTTDAPRSAASVPSRVAANLIDVVILAAFDLVGFSPVFLILFFRTELKAHEAGPDWLLFVVALLSSLVVLGFDLWYVVGGWAKRGRTPGKSILELSLVRREASAGHGVGWDTALRRALYVFVGCLPLGAGFWSSLLRADRRAWHDIRSGTWVVKTK